MTTTVPAISTVRDLVMLWGDTPGAAYANLADEIGEKGKDYIPRDWARRHSIPADKIHPLVNAAQKRGFRQITHEFVTRLLAEQGDDE